MGPIGALISAWPALALVGSFELLMMLIRTGRGTRVGETGPGPRYQAAPPLAQEAPLELPAAPTLEHTVRARHRAGRSQRAIARELDRRRRSWLPLLTNTRARQRNLIEAPGRAVHGGDYTPFYSANDYASANYGIGYASCRATSVPVRTSRHGHSSHRTPTPRVPGTVRAAPVRRPMVDDVPRLAVRRHRFVTPGQQLWLEPITWHGSRPSVHPLQSGPQPAPNLAAS
jgi:hypothetical protein